MKNPEMLRLVPNHLKIKKMGKPALKELPEIALESVSDQ